MNEFKVEKGIPVPQIRGTLVYPFENMEVGDSFLITVEEARNKNTSLKRVQSNLLADANRRKDGSKFTTRTMVDGSGIRCWRVK